MEYTVHKLARLAGISTRTLRYYDEVDLLKPARINSSGYRIYGRAEVDRLQQILFYKELGLHLDLIKKIVTDPSFDRVEALREHREQLLDKRRRLDRLIANVKKTIASIEGRISMVDEEKFEGFKQGMIDENEKRYGQEIREQYGEDRINEANAKLKNMTQGEYEEVTRLEKQVLATLAVAFKTGDPAGELAQQAADVHKQWLTYYWSEYSQEAHAGLAQMYVEDERFKAYYDEQQPGMAEFLRDAIQVYTGLKGA
ncbi:DNA-binding transcriptional MerR regulator [Kroppenstedtia sanguinis]|uniref:MerR family transcriptional regulator n=1 Tax=Kroppenstedtia sanguinis TaxID=1380684 RepID=A0ABW4C825_9BACL